MGNTGAPQVPRDHDTIANFRREDLEALSKLFVQALKLFQKALVKLGNVAID
jgi:hypothetical protein